MAEIQPPPPLPKSQPSFARRQSTIIKLLGVGALVLVLLIPLVMITGVLNDRLSQRNEAVADITSSWGREQNVIGFVNRANKPAVTFNVYSPPAYPAR